MSIAHIVASINSDVGGPAVSVPQLLNALSVRDYKLSLFTLDYEQLGAMHLLGGVKVHSFHAHLFSKLFRGFHLGFRQSLMKSAKEDLSIIHSHGLWMYPNVQARVAANKYNIPFVISPRGMLEPWSQKKSSIKKKIAWSVYEKKNIESANYFHVTSLMELESVRSMGITKPVAFIPNGVEVVEKDKIPSRDTILKYTPKLKDKKWILFLSRIDPKKGIDILLEAWKEISKKYKDYTLVIAGPDLVGLRGTLEKYVQQNQMNNSVLFTGVARGELKSCLMAHAELFVLPSHSENYGNVVAESLSFGTPVITTKGTPWSSLNEKEAGWWVENTVENIKKTIYEALELPELTLWQMGENGRVLVNDQYTWEKISLNFEQFYSWIFTGKDRPSFVYEQ